VAVLFSDMAGILPFLDIAINLSSLAPYTTLLKALETILIGNQLKPALAGKEGVGDTVAVGDGEGGGPTGVADGVAVSVGVAVLVGVTVGVLVAVTVGVGVSVGVGLGVG
jgi:hypothetical protein